MEQTRGSVQTAASDAGGIAWFPQGAQLLFLACPAFEVLYDGTRGAGKTSALLMDFAQFVGRGFGRAWRGILFRREYKQLENVVQESQKLFPRIFPGCRFLESMSDYCWQFRDAEQLYFRVIKKESDYWNYHGHEYPWIGWEELTTWASLTLYEMMKSCCRSAVLGIPLHYRSTTNPYGPGHNVTKAHFVDPMPVLTPYANEDKSYRVRVHGELEDNRALLSADPGYMQRLEADPNPNRRKAWRYGDWDIVAGGIIDDLWKHNIHVLEPFPLPKTWTIRRSFDWGSSKPFSVGWWTESDGCQVQLANRSKRTFSRGTVFRIAEWYGWNGNPNEGLRMTATEIARGIIHREKLFDRPVRPGPADTSIFDVENGRSIADDMALMGVRWEPAQKSPGSRKQGWEKLRKYLQASLQVPMEEPGIFVWSTCRNWIRTVPVLPRDEKDPDDVDTEAEDHPGDETRYYLLTPARTSRTIGVKGV